jgi:steroid delta-isomerase-like uncharacterized protein
VHVLRITTESELLMSTTEVTTRELEPEFVEDWAQRFLDSWNALDGRAVASLCTEDITWRDPALPESVWGRDGVREFVETTGQAFPDFHITETDSHYLRPGSGRVLTPYRMTGTMLGPMEPFGPTGRKLTMDGVDDWTFRDGLLCAYATHYDTIEVARQLGVLPAAGTAAERIMARLQHVQARFQRRAGRAA